MKKIIVILGLVALSSCGNAPKCDDKEVTETVSAILFENKNVLRTTNGWSVLLENKNFKFTNIMTTNEDDKLQSCECEGTVKAESKDHHVGKINYEGNVNYFAQKNTDGKIIVKVKDIGAFRARY